MKPTDLIDVTISMVCHYYNVKFDDIQHKPNGTRLNKVIYPRQVIEYCLLTFFRPKYPELGSLCKIGAITGTHHATVINSKNAIESDIFQNSALGQEAKIIVKRVDRVLFKMWIKRQKLNPQEEIKKLQKRICMLQNMIEKEKA